MFSQGFTWFYWPYHKNSGKRWHIPGNHNDYGGYSEKDLYVPCKFSSYKEEILAHLQRDCCDLVIVKAKQYMATKLIRKMRPNDFGVSVLNYGISRKVGIDINHLIALILYCDFSTYCSDFSCTFRKISWSESMEDVKQRNSAFWYQSKYFREMVEVYGNSNGRENTLPPGTERETGPFYTGIDSVLAVPQFVIRLCSPTSTSKHMAVSLNFSKRSGMIITLNNVGKGLLACVPFMDVSWLSRYPDEDERVFAGLYFIVFLAVLISIFTLVSFCKSLR